jgi:hypothetical protein
MIWSPKGMRKSEGDFMLTIHYAKRDLPNVQTCKHIYAHQDTKKTKERTGHAKKGMRIDYEIEQITAKESDKGGNNSNNNKNTVHTMNSDSTDKNDIANVIHELTIGLLLPSQKKGRRTRKETNH